MDIKNISEIVHTIGVAMMTLGTIIFIDGVILWFVSGM